MRQPIDVLGADADAASVSKDCASDSKSHACDKGFGMVSVERKMLLVV